MSNIKIETLTAVHVGSGETLQYGNDFVVGKSKDGDNIIGIVDARKVMNLIGEDKISDLVLAIEKGESTADIVGRFAHNATIEDYAKRVILRWSSIKPTDTLKELIHDGMGRPYIPGSSIKGAIRTAVLASLVDNSVQDRIVVGGRVSAKYVEKNYFSSIDRNIAQQFHITDPNSDIFRFLQVGDAIFGNNYEVAIRMVNINERAQQSFWDTSKPQLIEAICPEDEANFQLNLKVDVHTFSQNKVHAMPVCMQSVSNMFQTINEHTKSLVEQEIEYWKERADYNCDGTDKVDIYLNKMNEIKSAVDACKEGKSCVLRIGHGSGWRFITGAWTEIFNNFRNEVVPASRPHNERYTQYYFPKTRRVDDQCELLGFVKLTL